MHLRKLIWVCGFACALLANVVAALGLGEVRLNSTLNEPLNAEIKLLDTRGLGASQIIVTLASPADFERNGVDRPYFLTEFQFEILLDHPGGAIVRVTSRSPVREPFINFLLEARWPTGRLLREYTLLMDLPTFSDSAAGAVAQAPTTRSMPSDAAPTSATQPRAANPARSASTRSSGAPSGQTGDSYTVGNNDTLWEIALDVRPDSSHSVHQTMLAIQRLNPDAFIDGNINLLRNGQVLRVPSSDDIQTVTRNDAVAEVARQNQVWSDDSMGAQLSATRRDASTRRDADAVSGSVRLATPGRNDTSAGQGSGDNTGSGRALETELAATFEELDKTKSENQELSSRVRDLEEQIETMERLVEVSNEQLRALQLSASQTDPAATTDAEPEYTDPYGADPVTDGGSVTEEPEGDLAEEEPATAEGEPVVAEEAPAVSEPVAPVDSRKVVAPPQPSKTILDHLMENLLWILLAIVVLAALVGAVIYRRKQEAETEAIPDDDFFGVESEADNEAFNSTAPDDIDDIDADEVPLFDEEEIPAEAETGDVVGEADIYIAYGKFDQAEEMLLAGLAKDPDSVDIRLKLLEVYSQTQDAEKFDHYYAGLIGLAGQPALARAAELREHIAGAGEFTPTGSGESFDADTLDISSASSIDLDESSETEDDAVIEDELDFSFDLEDDASPLLEEDESLAQEGDLSSVNSRYDLSFEEPASVSTPEEDEFSFDFDLEGASESETISSAPAEVDDEFAFELDDLDPEPEPAAEVSLDVSEDLEDLSFELDEPPVHTSTREVVALAPAFDESDEELELPDDSSDDFNLDMEMNDLDLAALDEEMEDLDADFVVAEQSEELEVSLGDDANALVEEDKLELELIDGSADAEDELSFNQPDIQPPEEHVAPSAVASPEALEDDEDVFDQALSEFAADESDSAAMPELDDLSDDDMDAELDFLADADEAATKLDLARAYIDMGDTDGARDILAEVAHEGNDQQRQEAVDLLSRIDA